MSTSNFKYGQKVLFPTNPIKYVFGSIGISSSDRTEMAEFVIDKYWPDDVEAHTAYKIKLVPVEQTGRIGFEKVYSSDLLNMIKRGDVKLITD